MRLQNFIGGQFLDPKNGKYFESVNPANKEVNALIPDSGAQDVDLSVDAAERAFESWSLTSASYRSEILLKIASLIQERIQEFALAESVDQGKPLSLALAVDIPRAIYNFKFFATAILHKKSAFTQLPDAHSYVINEPAGVAALISPWNLPLYLLTWKIAPCLAFGCTAICKPSEFTSTTSFLLCKVFHDAGLPAGVCNIVYGTGPSAGAPLINHPRVPLLSFTGGTATGKLVYKAAAEYNKKVSLELGGKNANIIFADCDYKEALTTSIRSSFSNQGEICLCGSRIFVEHEIYEKFVTEFKKLAEAMRVGNPLDASTQVGPLVSKQHFEKVSSYLEVAIQEGAKIECGGLDPALTSTGYFVRPTVITGMHPTESRLQQEEIFGPVVTITPFSGEEQVIKYANSTQYGLSASVWTENLKRANRVSRGLKVGTVWINTWMKRDLNVPFGGVKSSGLGREGLDDSEHFFTEAKTVCIQH